MNLTDAEQSLLREILSHNRDELRAEINRTDALAFKKSLRDRMELLESILGKLEGRSDVELRMSFLPSEQPGRVEEPHHAT